MDDPPPSRMQARSPRIGLVTIFAVLAFLVGVALMVVAMRNSGGLLVRPTPAPQSSPAPAQAQPPASQPAQPAVDATTLTSRENALTAQMAVLEARAASVDARSAAAAGQASRAEGIMVAFAARRAIDRGLPLGYLEEQLRQRFGLVDLAATTTVIAAARQPVTIGALRQALDTNADLLMTDGDGWFAGIGRELESLVVLHDVNAPSPLPVDRLARARRLLDAGQVSASLEEIERLPGAARASNWASAARRWIDVHKALDAIEAAAMNAPPARPAPVS